LGRTFTGWIAPACGWRTLFDHLVRCRKQGSGHIDADRSGGVTVERQFTLGRGLHWQIGRPFALENTVDIAGNAAILIKSVGP
jgi:hypothetical protein